MNGQVGRRNWYGSICLMSARINCHVTLLTLKFSTAFLLLLVFMLIEAELISNSVSFTEVNFIFVNESLENHISGFSAFFNLQ